jgi:hypothetical protein
LTLDLVGKTIVQSSATVIEKNLESLNIKTDPRSDVVKKI